MIVYPNPSHGLVNLAINGSHDSITVEFFDINGRIVHKEILKGSNVQINKSIDLSGLPKGMYILRISKFKKSLVKKVLIV